ncbi:MAG TPA: extracellular solute-binding protein [Pyrinomonadaceae bacterium]|nr:extracellular solute-binding protein [Pyrinomonadaceae bacterium]
MNVDNLRVTLKSIPVAIVLMLIGMIVIAMALMLQFRQRLTPAGTGATVTLTMWYLGAGGHHEKRFTDEMVRRYEQGHPGVKVLVTYYNSLDEYIRIINSALAGETAFPDLARGDQGSHSVDALVRQGRLVDLSSEAVRRGWRDRLQPGMLEYLGRRYTGGTFLIPSRIHFAGVFYNRQVFEKLGLQIPRTEREFESLLALLKREGQIPLVISGKTGDHLLFHWYALINNRLNLIDRPTREILNDLFAGKNSVAFDSEPFKQGAEKIKEWMRRGYFNHDFASLTGPEAYDRFLEGKSPLYLGLGGSWAQERERAHPPQFVIGFFPFPPPELGKRAIATGSPTSVWQVFKGDDQAAAIELTDWMLSHEVGRFLIENQNLPALRMDDLRGISLAPHLLEEISAFKECDLGIFYDNASPALRGVMKQGVIQLMAGEKTVDGLVTETQAAFQKDLDSSPLTIAR